MVAAINEDPTAGGFNGLKVPERTLESSWYFDPAHYQHELARIWRRNWIYLCRADSLPAAPSFRTFTIGDQPIIVVRDRDDTLRAFFNTCRHRGSTLCPTAEGRLPTGHITCPYHAWSYRLDGTLAKMPSVRPEGYLDTQELSLYSVALRNWRGFVYVHLGDPAQAGEGHFNENRNLFGNWPLEELVVGRTLTKRLACNWKIFWENYNECLHCPGVHPGLSSLVPIYKRGIMEPRDDPQWRSHEGNAEPLYAGGLRAGAQTWSVDGKPVGPTFPRLTEEERRLGYHYMTSLPSHYLVLHVDHVRSSRLLPLGPESMELEIQWLFPAATLADPSVDIARACDFSAQVMSEDGAVCELTQRGLHAAPHHQGYLLPEDYDVFRFQQWVRAQLR
ncbi:MAG TPA: aromatic ring-hydroxylating dioxygenase subunit alpha [Steroidobacteraceae bacterium]|nr:aromatic ring-hydroxylating dioxygenase subunit alpha [Steroidobacteraceae bacterium]